MEKYITANLLMVLKAQTKSLKLEWQLWNQELEELRPTPYTMSPQKLSDGMGYANPAPKSVPSSYATHSKSSYLQKKSIKANKQTVGKKLSWLDCTGDQGRQEQLTSLPLSIASVSNAIIWLLRHIAPLTPNFTPEYQQKTNLRA